MNRKLNSKYWLQLIIPPRKDREHRPTKYSNSKPEDIYGNDSFPGHSAGYLNDIINNYGMFIK